MDVATIGVELLLLALLSVLVLVTVLLFQVCFQVWHVNLN